MKYCIQYTDDFKELKDKIDEVIIEYTSINNFIIKFIQENIPKDMRVILDIPFYATEDEFIANVRIWEAIKEIHPNFCIKISLGHRDSLYILQESGIPYFFDTFIDRWDDLTSMVYAGVTDVYICNELGFQIKDVSKFCKKHNVKVRVFPNVAQTSAKIHNIASINQFFVRPEDTVLYEPYVDIFEIFGDKQKYNVYLNIYHRQTWIGDWRDLIIGFKDNVSSKYIVPHFGERRLNCGKICSQEKCNMCNEILTLAKNIKENNYIVDYSIRGKNGEKENNEIGSVIENESK